MSESVVTSRLSGGADEFERRIRALASTPETAADPLAELARLIGQNDPFRPAKPQIRAALARAEPVPPPGEPEADAGRDFASFEADLRGAIDAGDPSGMPGDPAVVPADRSRAVSSPYARAPEVSPDSWARGDDPATPPELTATRDDPQVASGGSSKRTLIVLAAVVALTGGGLAASFLARPSTGSGSPSVASNAPPTILAASGPSKVQPETPAADPNAPSEPSTLLDKNKNDGTASAKVVNSVEQPLDLNQAVKPATAAREAGEATASTASSPFPEPRKVKTVLVRPDGTIITDHPLPAAGDAALLDTPATLAFDPKTSLPLPSGAPSASEAQPAPVADAPVPAPATPAAQPTGKSHSRVAVTPKASGTVGEVASATQAHAATTPKPKPAVKPAPVQEAVAAPTPPAAAPDADAAPAASGKFAAQLGAAGSEEEARSLTSTLSRKYADAVGGRLSVRKAQSGARTVYRIRASGLSQEAARAVCSKVTSGGGGCFVARD